MLPTPYRLRLEAICEKIVSGDEVSLDDMIWANKLAKSNQSASSILRKARRQARNPEMKEGDFDDTVVSVVPEGEVPFKKNEVPIGTDHTSLRREHKNLYHFVRGGNDSLSTIRRETMLIQLLEGLHPEEAEIICLTKDKLLQSKYKITYELVKEAYPDIQWGGRS